MTLQLLASMFSNKKLVRTKAHKMTAEVLVVDSFLAVGGLIFKACPQIRTWYAYVASNYGRAFIKWSSDLMNCVPGVTLSQDLY